MPTPHEFCRLTNVIQSEQRETLQVPSLWLQKGYLRAHGESTHLSRAPSYPTVTFICCPPFRLLFLTILLICRMLLLKSRIQLVCDMVTLLNFAIRGPAEPTVEPPWCDALYRGQLLNTFQETYIYNSSTT